MFEHVWPSCEVGAKRVKKFDDERFMNSFQSTPGEESTDHSKGPDKICWDMSYCTEYSSTQKEN